MVGSEAALEVKKGTVNGKLSGAGEGLLPEVLLLACVTFF
jgi:hypothetical protein